MKTLAELEQEAQQQPGSMQHPRTFLAVFPSGPKNGRFLDPFMGILQVDGVGTFAVSGSGLNLHQIQASWAEDAVTETPGPKQEATPTPATIPAGKTLLDKNGKVIGKGTIVRYGEGWMRVTAVFIGSKTVNLGGIFTGKTTLKHVALADVFEDYEAWSAEWSKSESYQSM